MKVRIPRSAIVLGCTAALVVPGSASAAAIMQADGITGESQEQGFEGGIDIGSVQWGIGRSAKGASFSEITVTKQLDSSSTSFASRVATGAPIPNVRISLRSGGDQPITFQRLCLTGVRVTGFSQSSGGGRPSESLSLSYATIIMRYAQQGSDGSVAEVFRFGWNVVTALQFPTASCDT
jgi:type VI secretion system secreted protein Hcp